MESDDQILSNFIVLNNIDCKECRAFFKIDNTWREIDFEWLVTNHQSIRLDCLEITIRKKDDLTVLLNRSLFDDVWVDEERKRITLRNEFLKRINAGSRTFDNTLMKDKTDVIEKLQAHVSALLDANVDVEKQAERYVTLSKARVSLKMTPFSGKPVLLPIEESESLWKEYIETTTVIIPDKPYEEEICTDKKLTEVGHVEMVSPEELEKYCFCAYFNDLYQNDDIVALTSCVNFTKPEEEFLKCKRDVTILERQLQRYKDLIEKYSPILGREKSA